MNVIEYSPATNLGNWLFQIAFARCLTDEEVAIYIKDEYNKKKFLTYRELYPNVKVIDSLPSGLKEYTSTQLEVDCFNLPTQRDGLLLKGCFQYERLFDRTELKKMFRPPDWVFKHIHEKYGAVFNQTITVGISVRRGDYLNLPHRHPFVGRQFLKSAVELFDVATTFIVCSDDLKWCKKYFSQNCFNKNKFIFIENEPVLVQLYIHTFCNHNIVSNSTFSWWGACLNRHSHRRVIMPSMWYGIAMRGRASYLYFEDAEVITNHYSLLMLLKAYYLCLRTRLGKLLRHLLEK